MDDRCCGITSRGRRCKLKSKTLKYWYRIPFQTCRYHSNDNVVHKWSCTNLSADVPPTVLKYIHLYNDYYKTYQFSPLCLLMLTTFSYNISSKNVLEDFLDFIAAPTHIKECSICYEDNLCYSLNVCKHETCRQCLSNVIKYNPRCPMCRRKVF